MPNPYINNCYPLRYYNTSERMTSLFAKITEQMIANCKMHIIGDDSVDSLWESDPQGNSRIVITV
jgi:hypothetical protein